jgi:hypothetical protein
LIERTEFKIKADYLSVRLIMIAFDFKLLRVAG